MTELELLAPARNLDIGIAAIDCGADAVYIAAEEFGARQAAGNSIEDIARLCSYAHRYGARIFVTVNTILYEEELERAYRKMLRIQEAGADALIVQDMAVIELANNGMPGIEERITIPVHASTQCSIRTTEKAKELETLGFSRIILERELSLDQIRAISEAVSCEVEFFVHGALCVCYSGQCYMSERLLGRSANRGACAQPCRSRYDLIDAQGRVLVRNKALLSLKDYNLSERLEDLASAGVKSFKIEGRLKNESYVRNVVREYSLKLDELISAHPDLYCRASFGRSAKGFNPDTYKTFNRGYTELFIDGVRGKWASMEAAKGMGEPIGTITSADKGRGRLDVAPLKGKTMPELSNGDGFSFVARNGEVIGFRGDVCENHRSGAVVKAKAVPELYPGALLYRNLDSAFEKMIEREQCVREITTRCSIDITGSAGDGYRIVLKAITEDGRIFSREYESGVEAAQNKERMLASIKAQIGKSAEHFAFEADEIRIATSDGSLPFVATSFLNGIRREAAQNLSSQVCIARKMMNRTGKAAIASAKGEAGAMASAGKSVSYKANVANPLAQKVYRDCGAGEVEAAYELTHKKGAELMRTKYCIRHELGMCLKEKGSYKGDLYLTNNGRRFSLGFDCSNCEMTVKEA